MEPSQEQNRQKKGEDGNCEGNKCVLGVCTVSSSIVLLTH